MLIYCPQMCIEIHTKDIFYVITDKAYDGPSDKREALPYVRCKFG